MKKLLLFLITAATLTTTATAQNLVINGKDGSTTDLNLESLRKITFSKGNLVARYSDGTYYSISKPVYGEKHKRIKSLDQSATSHESEHFLQIF